MVQWLCMTEISKEIASSCDKPELDSKSKVVADVEGHMANRGYRVVEVDEQRPWGAFIKFDNSQAESFIDDFFPGLDIAEARLGDNHTELSPKVLIVSPGQRLSWQYHNRRAERWCFLTDGSCERGMSDTEGDVVQVGAGGTIQFSPGERHRLIGRDGTYTLVAEIWQHIDPSHPSDEDDIVRLADDYSR
jgi:mannose-6-phosphate isomerase-like protein (cupin superfamily)